MYNLLTLEERRSLLDVGLLYDVLRNRIDCPELLANISFSVPKKRTRHTSLFQVPFHATNYGQNSVITRIVRTYTKSFNEVDVFTGTKINFKRKTYELLSNDKS